MYGFHYQTIRSCIIFREQRMSYDDSNKYHVIKLANSLEFIKSVEHKRAWMVLNANQSFLMLPKNNPSPADLT